MLNILTGLFNHVDLKTNTKKTQVVTFLPGKARTFLPETTYCVRTKKDLCSKHKGHTIECSKCGKLLTVEFLASQLAFQHNVYQ